jgi:hypothetical protein
MTTLAPQQKTWIIVASREHVQRGITEGFAQACHGKCRPLQHMTPGDWIVYYSSKEEYGKPTPCQKFTAVGQVRVGEVYPYDMGGGFVPFRRDIAYVACQETAIQPLINDLSFIRDKQHWGAPFRFGILSIPQSDFLRIADAMQVTV